MLEREFLVKDPRALREWLQQTSGLRDSSKLPAHLPAVCL